jgi:hypothetical protein
MVWRAVWLRQPGLDLLNVEPHCLQRVNLAQPRNGYVVV